MTNQSNKKYYILYGLSSLSNQYELIFGDYDRDVVYAERDDQSDKDDYTHMRVRRTSDDQAAIDKAIASLNL